MRNVDKSESKSRSSFARQSNNKKEDVNKVTAL